MQVIFSLNDPIKSYYLIDPTIEDTHRKQCEIDGEVAFLEILDTAGQEDYETMRPSYIRSGEGFLLVYSVIDRVTFNNVQSLRDEILIAKDSQQEPIIIVGNKTDLEEQRTVSTEEGYELACCLGCGFYETSAKLSINIENAFYSLIRTMREKRGSKIKKIKKKTNCIIL
ncbi:ras-like protein [Anaeramoeba flamelloides]|uniref:Ras-like protein n=1 Tax=Anaeramoeba flamelloides TaxID=1746091 RepID=A0ABQ8Z766_9EUKA|nr:ras-like protein [Anaeramoeba flamelloides]